MAEIVPNRLFFSRLPTGELEFSCLIRLARPAGNATVSWALRAADDSRRSLVCERIVRDDELTRSRAVLSAILPADWPDSILTVAADSGTSAHEVHRFHQHQPFSLPFASEVLVAAGHRIGEPHRVAFGLPAQQFAWDLVPLRPGNLAVLNTQMSEPPRSADLACYGRKVLSPAPGVVVAVVDGIPDAELLGERQIPRGADITWAAGNHVIIRHDNHVHSCLAHLKASTIGVCVGQGIETGVAIHVG